MLQCKQRGTAAPVTQLVAQQPLSAAVDRVTMNHTPQCNQLQALLKDLTLYLSTGVACDAGFRQT